MTDFDSDDEMWANEAQYYKEFQKQETTHANQDDEWVHCLTTPPTYLQMNCHIFSHANETTTSFHSVNFAVLKFLTLTEDHQEAHQENNKSCILCKTPNFWETVDEEHR